MGYTLLLHPKVLEEDLPKIDEKNKEKIQQIIKQKLTTRPEVFGRPLRHPLNGLYKLRVGDWRVIFKIQKETVIILAVKHRSKAYKNFQRMISI
jgi:mRNA interferase RelE/StbE